MSIEKYHILCQHSFVAEMKNFLFTLSLCMDTQHLENCIPRPGSYTGAVDSMPLRTHVGSAAQQRPANTRSEHERRK